MPADNFFTEDPLALPTNFANNNDDDFMNIGGPLQQVKPIPSGAMTPLALDSA